MNPQETLAACDDKQGVCGLIPGVSYQPKQQKPIEIYTFIDPLCSECWAIEPTLKKLYLEYGAYFRIRVLLAGKLKVWNACPSLVKTKKGKSFKEHPPGAKGMSCEGSVEFDAEELEPYRASLAIKAAELQGPQAGTRFLRKLREFLFLKKLNITDEKVLLACAEAAGLDVESFEFDLHSPTAAKALQCDAKTTKEMDVESVPTFVFFNDNVEEEGMKVSGQYPYHVYVEILENMLGFKPERAEPIGLEGFLKQHSFVATVEVAAVLDISEEEATKHLKALLLQQKVEAVPYKYGTFWRYIQ
ncbi:ClpXP adapter SpxH family protein [Alkalicoccobacillus murimartini]|uniref:ClpXP adapter protein SpxH n=1 Tax=Alkalicoccobacillus murimartini TaxID=171685 RepID=A0ABT9YJ75_9BACI|nr:ClpXP adapter SpxH family protein [Alkalicoccobacillus murimartini]MDQ0207887.1 putative DsbA family dithiol-disulfide isomerase [Alkalicoccobacillus murimartini]